MAGNTGPITATMGQGGIHNIECAAPAHAPGPVLLALTTNWRDVNFETSSSTDKQIVQLAYRKNTRETLRPRLNSSCFQCTVLMLPVPMMSGVVHGLSGEAIFFMSPEEGCQMVTILSVWLDPYLSRLIRYRQLLFFGKSVPRSDAKSILERHTRWWFAGDVAKCRIF